MWIFLYLVIFVFGLVVGSFLNCVIYRLALTPRVGSDGLEKKESFLRGRSFCPHCKHTLGWKDLVPLLSFLVLKRKCRYCQKPISFQYPLVEIATGLLFLQIFNFQFSIFNKLQPFGESLASFNPAIFNFQFLLSTFYFLVIACFSLIIFVFDLKHFIIPDKIIFPAIVIALLYNLYQQLTILNSLYAAFGAAAFFLIIILISKGKWMGLGDVKLAFFMGLFLGFPNIVVALFLAFLIGAIIGIGLILLKRKHLKSELPFGPFLVTGTLIALFWGQAIAYWYLNLFSLTM